MKTSKVSVRVHGDPERYKSPIHVKVDGKLVASIRWVNGPPWFEITRFRPSQRKVKRK